jgi:hypothetical protein
MMTVPTMQPPAMLTPAQQLARDRAQALLNKLGQTAGILPAVDNNKESKSIVIK